MLKDKKVLLISGPSGSGKTSIAKKIANHPGWKYLPEDSVWGELYPNHKSRTPEMHEEVVKEIVKRILKQKNIVFEFLVYTKPPQIIEKYLETFSEHGFQCKLIVLMPSEDAVLERKGIRGRNDDRDTKLNKKNIQHQLSCLKSDLIRKEDIITDSTLTVDEFYNKYFKKLVEEI